MFIGLDTGRTGCKNIVIIADAQELQLKLTNQRRQIQRRHCRCRRHHLCRRRRKVQNVK